MAYFTIKNHLIESIQYDIHKDLEKYWEILNTHLRKNENKTMFNCCYSLISLDSSFLSNVQI